MGVGPRLKKAGNELMDRRDVVDKMGFEAMTPVQAGTIPRAMKHQDCVVEVSQL
jgi:superfamily II DNA/RNA helicase